MDPLPYIVLLVFVAGAIIFGIGTLAGRSVSPPASTEPPVRKNKASRRRHPHHGYCARCETSWAERHGHATLYCHPRHTQAGCTGCSGAFPLCPDCWKALTPQQRVPYYHRMIDTLWLPNCRTRQEREETEAARAPLIAAVLAGG